VKREIVLDTETTGLDAYRGDRLVEIGCVEMLNGIRSGEEFHRFINPERDVPAEAEKVHGLSTAFLADKPVFAEVADDFLAFIGRDTLVIHNAAFDVGFLNAELSRLNKPTIRSERVLDTLALARRKHPGSPATLDALCKRYGVDNTKRVKHGALMDSILLAEVYVELLGERQAALGLVAANAAPRGTVRNGTGAQRANGQARPRPEPLPPRLSQADIESHAAFIAGMGDKAIWRRALSSSSEAPAAATTNSAR